MFESRARLIEELDTYLRDPEVMEKRYTVSEQGQRVLAGGRLPPMPYTNPQAGLGIGGDARGGDPQGGFTPPLCT